MNKEYKFINAYGCVKCQDYNYEDEEIYKKHINFQSKHGVEKRSIEFKREVKEI